MEDILNILPSIVQESIMLNKKVAIGFKIKAKYVGADIPFEPEDVVTASMKLGKELSDEMLELMQKNKSRIQSRENVMSIHHEYPEIFLEGNSKKVNELLEVLILCIYTGKTIQEITHSNSLMRENSWTKKH
jgi:hypothetical protein